jgi:hypothetical protein
VARPRGALAKVRAEGGGFFMLMMSHMPIICFFFACILFTYGSLQVKNLPTTLKIIVC